MHATRQAGAGKTTAGDCGQHVLALYMQIFIQLRFASRGIRRLGNTSEKAVQAPPPEQPASKWQRPGKGRDARTKPNPPTPRAAIKSGITFPENKYPLQAKKF